MTYRYVAVRYNVEYETEHTDFLDAMREAWDDTEWNTAFPLDLWKDTTLVYSNRGGVPWIEGSCPFSDAIWEVAKREGWDI